MSVGDNVRIDCDVLELMKRISGRSQILLDQLVGEQVGIYGTDSVILLNELEKMYGIDLSPMVERHTRILPLSWWDHVLWRRQGKSVADLTVGELIDYVKGVVDDQD
jgi:hypothetical protein